MAETKVPALKNIPAQVDTETKLALESIKEALEVRLGRRGDPKDRAVTLRELIDSGLATDLAQEPYNPNTGATGFAPVRERPGDVNVPPAPTVLTASGLFTDVLLSWNQSTNTAPYGNHAFTEIWRSQSEDLSSAVLVGTTNAFIYTDQGLEYDSTYYYWVRFVSTSNTPGPWSNMASATTIENIAATMQQLSEELQDLPGYAALVTLISGSAGTAATVIRSTSAPTTRDNGDALVGNDIWIDTDDNNQAYFRNAANSAWIAARDSTLISLYNSISSTVSTNTSNISTAQSDIVTLTSDTTANASAISSLTSTVNSNTSAISTEQTTRANADTALATDITNLTSTVNSNTSAISSEATTRATADAANATAITALDTTVGTTNANVSTLQTAVSNLEGDADAMFVLQVATESNGSKSAAGMVIGSSASSGSGAQSYVQFQADKFAIWSGSSNIAPFIVDNGVVYIDQARIKDAAILDAKIGTLHGNKIIANTITATKIAAGTITATEIAADTITADEIASDTITANEISAGTITATEIDVDTLNVKHFADVSADIINQTSGTVPLAVYNSANQYGGSYPGDQINTTETTFLPITVNNVRNGATYQVLYSAVLGDTRSGKIQYSFTSNFASPVTLSPVVSSDAGTYRTYAFMWQGTITGMSTSQETVYWRINWIGGTHNSTYQSMYVYIDNTT